MHSHHSHSGSYSQHGSSSLDDIIDRVETLQMKVFCLTEHIPRRDSKYLYPEEKNTGDDTIDIARLKDDFDKFVEHAQRIKRERSNGPVKYIIGTEIESCDEDQIRYAKELMMKYKGIIKFCVGSVHHINGIPIDFDEANWNLALQSCGNNIKQMLLNYYNDQYKMLKILKPLVVGHMDVYKLFLPSNLTFDSVTGNIITNAETTGNHVSVKDIPSLINHWDEVRQVVIRNLQFLDSYNGLLEINTSALRKKLSEPYPGKDICQLTKLYCGGRFVLSDDSHSVAQVATCYPEALEYITKVIKLDKMYYLNEKPDGKLDVLTVPITEFKSDPFWTQLSHCL